MGKGHKLARSSAGSVSLAVLMLLAGCDGTPGGQRPGDETLPAGVKKPEFYPLTPAKLRFIDACDRLARVEETRDWNYAQIAQGLRQLGCLDVTAIEWSIYDSWRAEGKTLNPRATLVPVPESEQPAEKDPGPDNAQ